MRTLAPAKRPSAHSGTTKNGKEEIRLLTQGSRAAIANLMPPGSPARSRNPKKRPPKGSRPGRRRGPKMPQSSGWSGLSASAVLKQSKPPLEEKPTDEPLSPREVAAMKLHFQFLKRHRKVLRLNLNAQEDLLLNGSREPTRRGVCQHLLGKLDKARVLSAVERLSPVEATQLLEGIVRFSTDVAYLLLYLECVQKSAAQKEATSALGVALGQLDFGEISEAQMRKVLQLIAQVFSADQIPPILFGLLRNANFRHLFDSSQDGLPKELAQAVLPLRAAHAVVLQDRPNPCSLDDLRAGVRLLVQAPRAALLAHPPAVRERLFSLALDAAHGMSPQPIESLHVLLDSLQGDERTMSRHAMDLAIWLLVEGKGREAKRLLTKVAEVHPSFKEPGRWLRALGQERGAGMLVFGRPPQASQRQAQPRASGPPSVPPASVAGPSFVEGFSLNKDCPVFVAFGQADDAETLDELARVYERSCIPGVASLVERVGPSAGGRPYLAVRRPARLLGKSGKELHGQDEQGFRNLCRDVATAVSLLSARGVELLGLEPRRMGIDPNGRFWLIDLSGAKMVSTEVAEEKNRSLLREWLLQLASRATRHLPTAAWVSGVRAAPTCEALASSVDR